MAYFWPLTHVMLPSIGAAAVLLMLVVGSFTAFAWQWMVFVLVMWIVVVAIGLAIGLPVGIAMAHARADAQRGVGGALTVAWNAHGFTIVSATRSRFVPYGDVRQAKRAGQDGWFVFLRLRMPFVSLDPYVLALPADLVPPQVRASWGLDAPARP